MRVYSMKFTENLDCPIAQYISDGTVSVHGRKASNRNRNIKVGDIILFSVYKNKVCDLIIKVKVTKIDGYADVEEFVKTEGLKKIVGDPTKCLNIKSEFEYSNYYSQFVDSDEITNLKRLHGYGFLGFHIKPLHTYRTYRKKVEDPWFDLIKSGKKTVEGRLNKSWVSDLQQYDRIVFMRENNETDNFSVYVSELKHYSSFYDMIKVSGLCNVLPDPKIKTIDDGVNVYRVFYSENDEKTYGVVAIHMVLLSSK